MTQRIGRIIGAVACEDDSGDRSAGYLLAHPIERGCDLRPGRVEWQAGDSGNRSPSAAEAEEPDDKMVAD